MAFSSTGSIYGEAEVIPTPENAPFPIQTSLYGASKLAGEGLIMAYSEGLRHSAPGSSASSRSWASATPTATCSISTASCCADPARLDVLGDGKQRKSYLYVQDCIDAILFALERPHSKVHIFNLGTPNIARSTTPSAGSPATSA